MNYSFCSVFKMKNRLYIRRERYAGGPRAGVFPPKELRMDIAPADLGREVDMALCDYLPEGEPIYADEWEKRNRRLLEYFGEKSVSSFERKKTEVNVRRDNASAEVVLLGPKNKEIILMNPLLEELGTSVINMLFKGKRPRRQQAASL